MGHIVKCDICGKIYNQSYLSSHKRLTHGKRAASRSSDEPASVEAVLSMYEKLPENQKKEVRDRLAAANQTKL